MTNLSLCRPSRLAIGAKLADEVPVVERGLSEGPFAKPMLGEEGLDVSDEFRHGPNCMGEISPGQLAERGIFRESRYPSRACDISFMDGKPDIAEIRRTIEREMVRQKLSRRGLSTAAGVSQSTVRDLLDRTDNPGIGTLSKVADALKLPFDAISGSSSVKLGGSIGAGGRIAYVQDEDPAETVPRPPLAFGPLLALEVHGTSMLPKYEAGDIIYVKRDHDGVLKEYLGRYCAVHLTDGGTYLKRLTPGTEPDRYTLVSLNDDDMANVEVVWASPVMFVMSAETRRAFASEGSA